MKRALPRLAPPSLAGALLYLLGVLAVLGWLALDDLQLMIHTWSDR